MNNVIVETNKQMLDALENFSFGVISQLLYDEDFSKALRQEVAESICNCEEVYEHPSDVWE